MVVEQLNTILNTVFVCLVDPAVLLNGSLRAIENIGGYIFADLHGCFHFTANQHKARTQTDAVMSAWRDAIVDESRTAFDADKIHLAVCAAVFCVRIVNYSFICPFRSLLSKQDAVQRVIVF